MARTIFADYDPDYRAASLDEAALNVTAYVARTGQTAEQVASELRQRVEATTRLTCSAGIAPTRMLAKIGSDMRKPNGQFSVTPTRDAVLAFLADLPVRKIPGIGKVSERILQALGVETGAQLLRERVLIARLFRERTANFFLRIALGVSRTSHDGFGAVSDSRKSISHERTFGSLSSLADILDKALDLCTKLAAECEEKKIRGRTLTIKLKNVAFGVRQRSRTLAHATNDRDVIFNQAAEIIQAEGRLNLRLLGVKLSNLVFNDEYADDAAQKLITSFASKRDGPLPVDAAPERPPPQEKAERAELASTGGVRRTISNLFARSMGRCDDDGVIVIDDDDDDEPAEQVVDAKRRKRPRPEPSASSASSTCPICGTSLAAKLNLDINKHIDACLGQRGRQ